MARPIKQPALFDAPHLSQVINVALVPQRSPFRYPGGKTWLVPRIRQWLVSLKEKPTGFIEPFAGGGIVSLTVAAERLADHVTMVELDEQVAAVWRTIIEDDDGVWLANKIINFNLASLSPKSLREIVERKTPSIRERAFQTILKNRTYRGGILAAGSAPLKNGENGKGIASRWYAETLKKRILDIVAIRESITFIEGDGIEAIRLNAHRHNTVFYIDPPYTSAGKRAGRRLYTHSELDHEELFNLTSSIADDFLMTYDDNEEVRNLAHEFDFDTELVAMKNTHHAEMKELLIGRNLDWARSSLQGMARSNNSLNPTAR
jgi:DNA adenine methylase